MKICKNHKVTVKKSRLKIITVCIILISVSAGTVLSFSYISNGLKRAFMSSESYFKHIIRQNLNDEADRISFFISNVKENIILKNKTEEKSLIISTEEEFSHIIGDFDFYKDIKWLKNIKLDTKFTENDGLVQGSAKLYVNEKHITSLNCTTDDSFTYVSMPPVNEKILIADLNNSPLKTEKMLSAIPDEKTLSVIIKRYVNTVLENIEEVRGNNTAVRINGLTEKCHKLSAKLDGETLKEILEILKNDRDIQSALKNYSESFSTAPEFEKIFDSYTYMLDKYIQKTEENNVYIEIYVNSKGELIGLGFLDENYAIETLYIEKRETYGIRLTMQKVGGKRYTLEGGGAVDEKTASGKFSLSMETAEIFNINLQSADKDKLNRGVFEGKLSIALSDNIKPLLTGSLNLSSDNIYLEIISHSGNDDSDFKISLYNNDKLCLSANLLTKSTQKEDIGIFSEEDMKNSVEFSEWVKGFDLVTLTEKLREAEVPLSYLLMFK